MVNMTTYMEDTFISADDEYREREIQQSYDAEVQFYQYQEEARQEQEERQAEEDYAYVRDETIAAIAQGVGYFDPEEAPEDVAHRIALAVRETEVFTQGLLMKAIVREILEDVRNLPEDPVDADFEVIFNRMHSFGWVHI